MKPVTRAELLDHQTYAEGRAASRPLALAVKEARRVQLGPFLTFLFENRETVRYQVQEMMLAERLVKEAEIAHELATYNELLGGPGELGATLLIGIESPQERDEKLSRWQGLPGSVYLALADGTRVPARFDARQVDARRISAVHYLRFDVRGRIPVAVGCTFPELAGEVALAPAQREALAADLGV